ncbi:MAG TPA: winged helix-turn-helix domain-containing protein [Nitrososphaerales archaeon]|nr:winged helix-turn-helix domain-containing protein [Nitrososphaerales archaeon]
MANNSAAISREAGNLFMLFVLVDPFASAASTTHAPGVGVTPVQTAPGSAELDSTTTGVGVIAVYSSSSSTFVSLAAIVPGIWDESSKKRSRPQIYVEILELLKRGPMTPFEIAFYARLNHKRCKEYLRLLEREEYVQSKEEDGKTIFGLSENGKVIVDQVRNIFGAKNMTAALAPRRNGI